MVHPAAAEALEPIDRLFESQRKEIRRLRARLARHRRPRDQAEFPMHTADDTLNAAIRAVATLTAREPDVPITSASDPKRVFKYVAEAVSAVIEEARDEGAAMVEQNEKRRITPGALPLVSELISKLDESIA